MPTRPLFLDRGDLEDLLDELADELHRRGVSVEIVMVGGSWMLWNGDRAATRDVDSAKRLEADAKEVIRDVGHRHDLAPEWLNDHAAPFWPSGVPLELAKVVFERPGLRVRAPSPEVIFLMKLYGARPQDREDMVDLWPRCTFRSPTEAAAAFADAYPHAPEDEHLVAFVAEIAQDAADR